ncbi:MAG TPA: DUF378 domain-containing protein [Candidatus Limnocylindria bacterium]
MRILDYLATLLVVVGGINWGLVAIAKFDLVAFVTGQSFGDVNLASAIVYALVGVAALWVGVRALTQTRGLTTA